MQTRGIFIPLSREEGQETFKNFSRLYNDDSRIMIEEDIKHFSSILTSEGNNLEAMEVLMDLILKIIMSEMNNCLMKFLMNRKFLRAFKAYQYLELLVLMVSPSISTKNTLIS
jgi:hypothetical protein